MGESHLLRNKIAIGEAKFWIGNCKLPETDHILRVTENYWIQVALCGEAFAHSGRFSADDVDASVL